jgi:hypothetical protein
VDPLAQQVTVNPKHERKMDIMCVASFLFFSNNEDALHVPAGTRRIFTCRNAYEVRGPDYFRALRAWMKTDWQQHVWNWLRTFVIDLAEMSSAPPETESHHDMREAGKSVMDHKVAAAIAVATRGGSVYPVPIVLKVLMTYFNTPPNGRTPIAEDTLMAMVRKAGRTFARPALARTRIGGVWSLENGNGWQVRVRTTSKMASTDEDLFTQDVGRMRAFFEKTDLETYAGLVRAELIEQGHGSI